VPAAEFPPLASVSSRKKTRLNRCPRRRLQVEYVDRRNLPLVLSGPLVRRRARLRRPQGDARLMAGQVPRLWVPGDALTFLVTASRHNFDDDLDFLAAFEQFIADQALG
jgi:hypothetical protein